MWKKRAILFLFVYFLLLCKVNALGMATDYVPDNTILLAKGESKLHRINLQNPDDESMKVRFELHETEIAKITGDENVFVLPPKNFDKNIYINITIPKNAKTGEEFIVGYSLISSPDQGSGFLGMGARVNGKVNVKVVSKEGEALTGKTISVLERAKEITVKGKEDISSIGERVPKEIKNNISLIIFLIAIISFVTLLIFKKSMSLITIMKMDDKKFLEEAQKGVQIHPDKYFYLHSGGVIKSLHELWAILKNMEEHVFNHHVNEEKNDFANWIRHVFQREELADDIQHVKERDEIINRVRKHLS